MLVRAGSCRRPNRYQPRKIKRDKTPLRFLLLFVTFSFKKRKLGNNAVTQTGRRRRRPLRQINLFCASFSLSVTQLRATSPRGRGKSGRNSFCVDFTLSVTQSRATSPCGRGNDENNTCIISCFFVMLKRGATSRNIKKTIAKNKNLVYTVMERENRRFSHRTKAIKNNLKPKNGSKRAKASLARLEPRLFPNIFAEDLQKARRNPLRQY